MFCNMQSYLGTQNIVKAENTKIQMDSETNWMNSGEKNPLELLNTNILIQIWAYDVTR